MGCVEAREVDTAVGVKEHKLDARHQHSKDVLW
jgi:hypothetical protein